VGYVAGIKAFIIGDWVGEVNGEPVRWGGEINI